MNTLLNIENLSVDFSSESKIIHAVKNVSLSIDHGEVVAIVGESGSGKTVTSLSILQLLPAPPAKYSSGRILFTESGNTVDLLKKKSGQLKNIRGNRIGMIFQEPMSSLNPVFTCGQQVMESVRVHKGVRARKARLETIEWFSKVKLPDPEKIFHRYPHQLSGGQKQRIMIAMAMSCHPALLICDEPTTALDVTVQKAILRLIRDLQREQNIGVMFITHDLAIVAEVADRVLIMRQGEIVEQNSVKEILNNPQHPYTRALLACSPAKHKQGERLPVAGELLSGQFPKTNEPLHNKAVPVYPTVAADSPPAKALLKVRNLSIWFPSKKNILGKPLEFIKAVDNVDFEVYKGETVGLVGESGCGKTTLGRALLRLIEPTSGKIIYENDELTGIKKERLRSWRRQVQIVFQDPYSSLNPRITIGAAIEEPIKVHNLLRSPKQRREKVQELLRKVDLGAEHFNRYPHEFSGGQRQRIVIARALALHPSFIVCDEPVSALDVSVQAQVLNLLNDLKREFGLTIIFISHDLSVVRYFCNRILVMNNGKIEESGSADDIYLRPQHAYTKKLVMSAPGMPIT